MIKFYGNSTISAANSMNFKSRVIVSVDSHDKSEFITNISYRLNELSSNWGYDYDFSNLMQPEFDIYIPPNECSDRHFSDKVSEIKYDGNIDRVLAKLGLKTRNEQIKEYKKSIRYEF